MEMCRQRNVAVQTIKSLACRPWGDDAQTHTTWYKPLEEQENIDRAVHWVLNRPGIFLITAGDAHLLPKVLDAANRFQTGPATSEIQQMAQSLEMESLW
jgi:hypothetical protein